MNNNNSQIIKNYFNDLTDENLFQVLISLRGDKKSLLNFLTNILKNINFQNITISQKHLGFTFFHLERLIEAQYWLEIYVNNFKKDLNAILYVFRTYWTLQL